jgi:hypothetical protein
VISNQALPTLALVLLLGAAGSAFAQSATPDTVRATDPSPLRGTVEPLPRHANAFQRVAHAALIPPYAVAYSLTLPVRGLVAIHDRGHVFRRLQRWLNYRYEFHRIRLETFFGYESELGFAVAGFQLSQEDWRGEGGQWKLAGGFLRPDKNLLGLRLQTPPAPWQGSFTGYYQNDSDRPFYGLGPESEDRRLGANRRRVGIEATLAYHPREVTRAALTAFARSVNLFSPRHEDPVSDVFPQFFDAASYTAYGGVEGSLAVDGRDAGAYSTHGGLLRTWGGLDGALSDGDDDYAHYGVEGQFFLDLYRRTRILALRGFLEGVVADENANIPYVELERMGGRLGNRGYRTYRFADRIQMVWTAEYRYRVTHFIQAGLFVDWGTVARDVESLRLADLDPSYGFELNVGKRRPLTLQIAHSTEGLQFYLGRIALFDLPSRRLR